ncbi:MAG: bifunctional phosphoribosylaminoimidazolecarboxamide formyltransferase/IMP cyclohydrolase [Bacteroidales bacterium]
MQPREMLKVRTALVSVFHKEPARRLLETLHEQNVQIITTGGTLDYCQQLGIPAVAVEDITGYPSILGGRVKTLHPSVFGGILARKDREDDRQQMEQYEVPDIDMVVVDLYPFEKTLSSGATQQDIIEKIDIGGISLIRAAAKNFQHVLIVPAESFFQPVVQHLVENGGKVTPEFRHQMAAAAFDVSSHYDTSIFNFFDQGHLPKFKKSINHSVALRYGENPHQQGVFFGNLDDIFEQVWGKAISYNNLLDIDGAMQLMAEFDEPAFAIIKHTNACGVAIRSDVDLAWHAALEADPVSAFGGILIANRNITAKTAYSINELFFEVLIAPDFDNQALEVLQQKKNRILLKAKQTDLPNERFRSILNGVLWQSSDDADTLAAEWTVATRRQPSQPQINDMIFGNKVVKHLKSNAIALVKNGQLLGSGVGQTSRVDALRQAIAKAETSGLSLKGAVMASDAFFPFADSVEIARQAGIIAVIQPGGSVRDKDSVAFCDQADMAMVFTGKRHFKH